MPRAAEVMVVEDSLDDFQALARAISRTGVEGVELRHFSSAQEALDHLTGLADTTRLPHFMIIDLNMPGMDGKHLLRCIRADPQISHVPIIAMTNSSHAADLHECYAQGVNAYIRKPIGFKDMVDAMDATIRFWLGTVDLPRADNLPR